MFDEDIEEEEEEVTRAFENGFWIWNEVEKQLQFIRSSDQSEESEFSFKIGTKINLSSIQFKDDVDFIEQMRFRRLYQRKLLPDEADVITVQDIKDLVLFTAPITILSPMLINFLHTSSAERLLRSLIFYIQYYLQVSDKMNMRHVELFSKIRTLESSIIEAEFRENLADLRLLVAKEWSVLLVGGDDYRKYHHMGVHKNGRSLLERDAKLLETMQQMFIRIVWLALGRIAYNKIELEINRLLRSESFNTAEHNLKTRYIELMSTIERKVLFGSCYKQTTAKLKRNTPLIQELLCERDIDYRMLGLGTIQFPDLNSRLFHMAAAISMPEEHLSKYNVTVGILGVPRDKFDIMLRPIPTAPSSSASGIRSKTTQGSVTQSISQSKPKGSKSKSKSTVKTRIYAEIILPQKDDKPVPYPDEFPTKGYPRRPCSDIQREKWKNRLQKRILQLQRCASHSRLESALRLSSIMKALFGSCYKQTTAKVKRNIPLIQELFCEQDIDYRMLGLGAIRFPRGRQRSLLSNCSYADTQLSFSLRPIPTAASASSSGIMSKTIQGSVTQSISQSRPKGSKSKSKSTVKTRIYAEIILPQKDDKPDGTLILTNFRQKATLAASAAKYNDVSGTTAFKTNHPIIKS